MSSSTKRGGPSLAFKLGASAFMLVLTLGLLEAGARFLGPQAPSMRGSGWVLMGQHDTRLWGLPPGATQSRPFVANINEQGFRGEIPVMPKPESVHRLMLVGDSTFFGHGVDDGDTLADQIPAFLTQYGVKAEVVNLGVPGYSTMQTKLELDEVGWQYDPDVLLIGNLWSDNDFAPFTDADLFRTQALFEQTWWGRSSLLRLISASADRARGGSGARIVTWMDNDDWPDEGVRRVPIQDYARNLDDIIRDAGSRGVSSVMLTPCNTHLVDGEVQHTPWTAYFDAQAQVADHHGLLHLRACDVMRATGLSSDDLFMDSMHFSETGNKVVGRALAKALLGARWPFEPLPLSDADPFEPSHLVDTDPRQTISELTIERGPQHKLFSTTDDGKGEVTEPGAEKGPDDDWKTSPKGAQE